MERTFRMSKMLARLEKEGRMGEVTPEDLDLMKKLDGKVGNDYNWQSFVNNLPLVWIEKCEEVPSGAYVNVEDCD